MVQVKRNNNRRPFLRKQDENKRKEGKKKLITHRESTVTSKSLAPIRLLSSPSLPVGPSVPSINKSTAKNGIVVAIKPRYGTRCSAGTTREKKGERVSCQFNLSSGRGRAKETVDTWK